MKRVDRRRPEDDSELKAQILDTIERLNLLVARLEATIHIEDSSNGA